jgi:hypothetical protein
MTLVNFFQQKSPSSTSLQKPSISSTKPLSLRVCALCTFFWHRLNFWEKFTSTELAEPKNPPNGRHSIVIREFGLGVDGHPCATGHPTAILNVVVPCHHVAAFFKPAAWSTPGRGTRSTRPGAPWATKLLADPAQPTTSIGFSNNSRNQSI